ncbi:MAG: HAD family phosphatase [Lachnospiraceae bacterium]|nr:HAD family phosphatase [Lachnospiraceae bacterium]
MKTKLAIFDLDGTLFDTRKVNYQAYKLALDKYNVPLDYDEFASMFNGRLYKTYMPKLMGDIGTDENIEDAHNLKIKEYPRFLKDAVKNESLFSMIDCMKNDFHIALVTTGATENVYQILDYFNVRDKFELILTQNDVVNKKPDPEGFLKAMDYFKVDADNTIVFEDSDVGLAAAKAAGCVAYIVKGYA